MVTRNVDNFTSCVCVTHVRRIARNNLNSTLIIFLRLENNKNVQNNTIISIDGFSVSINRVLSTYVHRVLPNHLVRLL